MVRDFVDLVERTALLVCAAVVLGFLALHAGGCVQTSAAGRTVHLDPDVDDDIGGTGVDSGDLRACSERIARGIASLPRDTGRPRVVVLPVQNHTRFRIDPKILTNRLTRDLHARAGDRVELFTLDVKPARALPGEYVLVGEMRSLTKAAGEVTSDYIHYSFALTDAQTGAVVWAEDFDTKKKSSIDVVYR